MTSGFDFQRPCCAADLNHEEGQLVPRRRRIKEHDDGRREALVDPTEGELARVETRRGYSSSATSPQIHKLEPAAGTAGQQDMANN